jgi:hypothetical protein
MRKTWHLILPILLLAACARPPVISDDMMRYEGGMPADFSGSWERDYSRGDDYYAALGEALYRLSRATAGPRGYGQSVPGNGNSSIPSRQRASLYAIARLADEITRPQVLTIAQNDHEISIARKDDYAIFCAFYDGAARNLDSNYGAEVCGWDGEQLVSHVTMPDGLEITHRFTVAPDGQNLRVVTTVQSATSSIPFTLSRFYKKFPAPTSDFNCVETLSMKRVCSTGDLEL